ncbi:hypothetical protein AGMMS50229_08430 [Campylobacterota bacterium]|nr:hypothetical protein AGMMS50229_08380 [Campylobacterota bacterium]GHV05404.1 hypothetical protein AGMMS50229_08430 [Campylobacterota bacterium]
MTFVRELLFAVDREGIFVKIKEAERGATGAYFSVCNRAPSEDDAEIGEKTERAAAKRLKPAQKKT